MRIGKSGEFQERREEHIRAGKGYSYVKYANLICMIAYIMTL